MRAMKDSGILWIGEIPEGWTNVYLKHYFAFEKGKNAALYTQEYIGENEGIFPVYSGQTENEGVMGRINTYDYDEPECLFTTTVGAKVMTPRVLQGKFSLSQNCLIMKSIKTTSVHFFYYGLSALFDYEKSLIPSHMQPSLRIEDLKKYKLFIPPLAEQQRIAEFLDRKCAEVDEMIALQEQIIEELKAYKQSVITESVTKGLNPDVPMKDSGIEWIGQIPEHWEQGRLKNYFHLHGRIGWNGLRSEEFQENSYAYLVTGQDFLVRNVDWNRCYQICKERYDEDEYIQLKNGDILVTKDGTIGKVAVVTNLDKPACLNSGIFVVKQFEPKRYNPDFIYWLFVSPILKTFNDFLNLGGTTIIHLYQNVFERMPMVLPPIEEQEHIAEYLNTKCTEIDNLISIKQLKIDSLKEYKKSIIYEYVTGKREVE